MMLVGRKIQFAVALVGAMLNSGSAWAGDSLLPIDHCQEINAGDQASYVLVKNIFSPNRPCLVVTTSHVTIDLRGFTISGNGSEVGISSTVPVQGVKVLNGTVKGFAVGISLAGQGNVVKDVHVDNNTDTGIHLGAGSLVQNVVAQGNRKCGIVADSASTVKDSLARFNGNSPEGIGISVGPGSTVTGNTVSNGIGVGLFASAGSTVLGNTVLETNPGYGMSVVCPSLIKNNTLTASTQANLVVTDETCLSFDNVAP